MMDNDNDFTFCQVSSPVNQDGLETNKLASDMGEITINEESSNASRSHSENSGVLWMDGLPHNSNSKKQASVGSLSYSVIDTTPSNHTKELNTKPVPSDAENSLQRSSEQRKPMQKPINEESSNAGRSHSENSGVLWMDGLPHNSNSKKQASVGSLSYSVIDTTPSNQTKELNTKPVPSDAENSLQRSSEQRKPMQKPTSRVKVPFEKGYSQMDWLKLTRSHPDLAGLKGQSNRRLISLDEVRQHQTEGQMWTVLKGRVYNISPYMKFHPGGVDMLMKAVGKDCTSLFNKYHAWVNAEFLLEKCLVGTLDDSH